MHKQNVPAIPTTLGTPEPRRSGRDRKATTRFLEGWFGLQLLRLSSALGVGAAAKGSENNHATKTRMEDEVPPNCDDEIQANFCVACDEVQVLGVMVEEMEEMEEEDHHGVCTPEPRRSGRERKATRRFEEGWFGGRLPTLSAALGVVVSDGKGR